MVERRHKGLFITFEGPEGGGKTTQSRRLHQRLVEAGHFAIWTHEPGGTAIGDSIRAILLDEHRLRNLNPRVQTLLIEAARAQHVEEVIRPHLIKGAVVVCDRYIDSTLAYQGGGFRVAERALSTLNRFATRGLMPDLTVMVDIDVTAGLGRKFASRGTDPSAVQSMEWQATDFHERVRKVYLRLVTDEPDRMFVLDGAGDVDAEHDRAWQRVQTLVKARGLSATAGQGKLL